MSNCGVCGMDYITVRQTVEKWGISERRIQKLCEEKRIDGVLRFGRSWMIPKGADKPADARNRWRKDRGR